MDTFAQVVLYFASFILIAVGGVAVLSVKSDIQIIVAVLAFGFGFLLFAAAWVVGDLSAIKDKIRRQA